MASRWIASPIFDELSRVAAIVSSLRGLSNLSRRDNRTQPGVLTLGTDIKDNPPCKGGRISCVDQVLNKIQHDLSAALSGRVAVWKLSWG